MQISTIRTRLLSAFSHGRAFQPTTRLQSPPVPTVAADSLKPIMKQQIARDTAVMTDDFSSYHGLKQDFAEHKTVKHSQGEYVRGRIHTNTVENYFSILKRGLRGVYQHVGANHLRRYIAEFDFRYSLRKMSDQERAAIALRGIEGKRLLYTIT